MPRRRSPDAAPAAAQRRGGTTLTPTSGNPPSGGEEGCGTTSAKSRRHSSGDRHTRQLQQPWHCRRKPYVLRPPAESADPLMTLQWLQVRVKPITAVRSAHVHTVRL